MNIGTGIQFLFEAMMEVAYGTEGLSDSQLTAKILHAKNMLDKIETVPQQETITLLINDCAEAIIKGSSKDCIMNQLDIAIKYIEKCDDSQQKRKIRKDKKKG